MIFRSSVAAQAAIICAVLGYALVGCPVEDGAEAGFAYTDLCEQVNHQVADQTSQELVIFGSEYFEQDPLPAQTDTLLPELTVEAAASLLPSGGATRVRITYTDPDTENPLEAIIVVHDGTPGFFKLPLEDKPAPAAPVVAFGFNLEGSQMLTFYGLKSSGKRSRGAQARFDIERVSEHVAQIQVSISFDKRNDIDLLARASDGVLLYTGRRESTGGAFDLAANDGCMLTDTKAENLYWTQPPSGDFEVFTALRGLCEGGDTQYVVTLRRLGGVEVYTGTLYEEELGRAYRIACFNQ